MAQEYTYLSSGATQALIRPSGEAAQYDIANIDEILGDNALSGQKVAFLDFAKILNVIIGTAQIEDAAITNAKIADLSVSKLTAGTLGVAANVGNGNVQIDGVNKRLIVNDGTNDRGLFGFLSGGF